MRLIKKYRFQIIGLVLFVVSFAIVKQPPDILIGVFFSDDHLLKFYLEFNDNVMAWVYNISKLLFIISLGYMFKKERLVVNELYPIGRSAKNDESI